MQIASFSTSSVGSQALHPILYGGQATAKPADSSVTSASTTKSNTPTTNATQTAAPARSTQSKGAPAGGGGAAAATATEEMMVSSYSTTVNGTRYSGSVEQSGSEYTASVASLPGATATGSSAQAAENNLSARIDELV